MAVLTLYRLMTEQKPKQAYKAKSTFQTVRVLMPCRYTMALRRQSSEPTTKSKVGFDENYKQPQPYCGRYAAYCGWC
eukprot:6177174-Pleurochrysis_carterae.AAC.7